MARDASRPIFISILAILYFLGGLLFFFIGIVDIAGFVDIAKEFPEYADLAGAIGIVGIVFGVISLIIAGGFWNGWTIMWYLGIIYNGIGLILSILGFIATIGIGTFIPLAVYALLLFYMFRPGVKDFFGI